MGFHSVEGQGSTFAFFVKTRRVAPPEASVTFSKRHDSVSKLVALEPLPLATEIRSLHTPHARTSSPASTHILLVEDNLINQKVYVLIAACEQ